jgi:hypothetical protein
VPDGEIEFRIDGEHHTVVIRDSGFEARQGGSAQPTAIVEVPARALFRLVNGQAQRRELERGGQIAVEGDTRTARGFLDAAHGAWLEPAAR